MQYRRAQHARTACIVAILIAGNAVVAAALQLQLANMKTQRPSRHTGAGMMASLLALTFRWCVPCILFIAIRCHTAVCRHSEFTLFFSASPSCAVESSYLLFCSAGAASSMTRSTHQHENLHHPSHYCPRPPHPPPRHG
ncbi:hypothetical protein F5I97DRAFT_994694 [Phlebopus sp. FC_14]|nr:hypothetical protein F5I97DRAFT_994694 [Phlebopus sp. FC_14]